MLKKLCLLAFLYLLSAARIGYCANPAISGREAHIWEQRHISVVIARITELRSPVDRPRIVWTAKIKPIMLVAGELDPSTNPELEVAFDVCDSCNVVAAPPKDALILIVLMGKDCASMGYGFMPKRAPLAVLEGLGDKQIEETLENIREVRAHPDPDPDAAPPTNDEKAPVEDKTTPCG